MLFLSVAKQSLPVAKVPFLQARENYLIARARYENHERHLQALLDASDTGASLETAMLVARTKGQHTEPIMALSVLGTALDKAGDVYDLAKELQRKKIAAQEAAFHNSFRNLDE